MQCMQQRFEKFVHKIDVRQLNNLFCESDKGNSQKTYAVDKIANPLFKVSHPKNKEKKKNMTHKDFINFYVFA